jgi:hypothetical protein
VRAASSWQAALPHRATQEPTTAVAASDITAPTFSVAKAALARWQPAIDECVATFAVDVVLPQEDAAGTPAPKPGKQ